MSDLMMNVTSSSTEIPSFSSISTFPTENNLTTVGAPNIPITSSPALMNFSSTTVGTTLSSIIVNSGSHLKFREDGLREPPSITAPANLIIIIVGLSILIVPVVCVFIAICARTRVFLRLKDMKFSSGGSDDDEDESKLPYSQFNNPSSVPNASKPRSLKISSDIRVLIDNDNATPGSPGHEEVPKRENRVLIRNSESADGLADDFQTADATFIVPGCSSVNNRSPAILKLDS